MRTSLGLSGESVSLNGIVLCSVGDPISDDKVERDWGRHYQTLAHTCTHNYPYIHLHEFAQLPECVPYQAHSSQIMTLLLHMIPPFSFQIFSLPWSPACASYLAIGCLTFYYTNHITFSLSINISYNKSVYLGNVYLWQNLQLCYLVHIKLLCTSTWWVWIEVL